MRGIKICLLVLLALGSLAQEKSYSIEESLARRDSLIQENDSIVDKKPFFVHFTEYNWGVYAAIHGSSSPNPGGSENVAAFLAGFQWKVLIAEVGLYSYQGDYSSRLIFPNEFQINYLLGSGALGVRIINNRWYELSGLLTVGYGDMLWERSSNFENLFRDEFWMFKPEIRFEFTPVKYLRPYLGVGYQITSNLELPQLENSDFSGVFLQAGIKIGFYNRMKDENEDL